jgi:hypothetical protein
MDNLLLVLRPCFSLDDTMNQVLMGKQKGSKIIRFGIMLFKKKRDYHSLFKYCKSRIGGQTSQLMSFRQLFGSFSFQ